MREQMVSARKEGNVGKSDLRIERNLWIKWQVRYHLHAVYRCDSRGCRALESVGIPTILLLDFERCFEYQGLLPEFEMNKNAPT